MDKLPDPFNMGEIQGRAEDKTPFVVVAIQECERMNLLTTIMRKTLHELDLGLKVGFSLIENSTQRFSCG